MNANQLLKAGQLRNAIDVVIAQIQKDPLNVEKRHLLCELLCIDAQFVRADNQLDILSKQDQKIELTAALLRQLVRAEQSRQEYFSDGRVPEFVGQPTPTLQLHLRIHIELKANNIVKARELLMQADASQPIVTGECNGEMFAGLRDVNDRTAHFFEVLTSNGKYYWIAMEQVDSIEFHKPIRPLDLVWRRASMTVKDGPDGEIYMPAIYANGEYYDEPAKLGLKTDWLRDSGAFAQGIGQRVLLVGDKDRSFMELEKITIES